METTLRQNPNPPEPPAARRFRWGRLLLWLPVCLIHGAVVAWAASLAERFSAPVLVFSVAVGVALGAAVVGLIRVLQIGHRPTVLLGTVVAAAVAVAGQHYAGYRAAHRAAGADSRAYQLARLVFGGNALAETPVPPEGFFEFLRWRAARGFGLMGFKARGWVVWVLWAADGVLVLGAAIGVVAPALRSPYCDRCRSWFRTTRNGPVDPATARRLAELTRAELPQSLASARYRLSACRGGCGPAQLRLGWVGPNGHASSVKRWLDPAQRNQVVQVLDHVVR